MSYGDVTFLPTYFVRKGFETPSFHTKGLNIKHSMFIL